MLGDIINVDSRISRRLCGSSESRRPRQLIAVDTRRSTGDDCRVRGSSGPADVATLVRGQPHPAVMRLFGAPVWLAGQSQLADQSQPQKRGKRRADSAATKAAYLLQQFRRICRSSARRTALRPLLCISCTERLFRHLNSAATAQLPEANPCASASNTTRIRREVRSSRWVTSQIGKRTGGTSSSTRMMPGVSRAISSIMAPMPIP